MEKRFVGGTGGLIIAMLVAAALGYAHTPILADAHHAEQTGQSMAAQ